LKKRSKKLFPFGADTGVILHLIQILAG